MPSGADTPVVRLPKSVTSPVVAIVTYSIVSSFPGLLPPANSARVGLLVPVCPLAEALRSPKSVAFPALAIVM